MTAQPALRIGAPWGGSDSPVPDGVPPRRALVWVGHRGLDAASLADAGAVRAIVCCDWGEELRQLSANTRILSVERESGQRSLWSSASLGSIPPERLLEAIRAVAEGGPALVVPYRTTAACEEAVRALPEGQARLLAPPFDVVDRLDDKRLQRRLFERWGLPTPTWTLARLENLRPDFDGIPMPAIVQSPRSSLGQGTLLVNSAAELFRLKKAWIRADELLLSQFVEGPVVNTTAAITDREVHLAWPSIQLTGLACCSPPDSRFAYCGNDYAAAADLPVPMLARLFALLRALGNGLRQEGFFGLFGADWILDGESWYLLEVNPRFQGSTVLLTALEGKAGLAPLVVEHLRAFLRQSTTDAPRRAVHPEPLMGAQVVLYQHRQRTLRTGPLGSPPEELTYSPSPPVWTLSGAPATGTAVASGAILGRLVAPSRVLDRSHRNLTPEALTAIGLAYQTLGMYTAERRPHYPSGARPP